MNKDETVSVIRSLLSSSKTPLSVSSLHKEFQNVTGTPMPLFGYKTVNDFLESIPNTVRLTGMYPIQKVHLVSDEKSAHIVSLVKRQKSNSKKFKNRNLFDRNKYYYKDIISNNWMNDVNISDDSYDEDVAPKPDFLAASDDTQSSDVGMPSDRFIIDRARQDHWILKDYLALNDKIPQIDLNLEATIGAYIEVHISQIHDPNEFFFQFRKYKKKLTSLMCKLQHFYKTHKNLFKMAEESFKPGQLCAAVHNGKWHRAVILHKADSNVLVKLIDFGGRFLVLMKDLRYLHQQFGRLPQQAISGSLANIESENNKRWSEEAIQKFFSLAYEQDLVAGIVDLDPKIFWMSLALTSTKNQEIHINDTLVQEGFAIFETSQNFAHFYDGETSISDANHPSISNLESDSKYSITTSASHKNSVEEFLEKDLDGSEQSADKENEITNDQINENKEAEFDERKTEKRMYTPIIYKPTNFRLLKMIEKAYGNIEDAF